MRCFKIIQVLNIIVQIMYLIKYSTVFWVGEVHDIYVYIVYCDGVENFKSRSSTSIIYNNVEVSRIRGYVYNVNPTLDGTKK